MAKSPLLDILKQETLATPAESPKAVQGIGGGLGDLVPATVEGQQPAALSEGEFVWPADVVSMLGDGSSEAGARILNQLVQEIRTLKSQKGGKEQAPSMADLMKGAK